MKASHAPVGLNSCKSLDLSHFHAAELVMLCDDKSIIEKSHELISVYLHVLRVWQGKRVAWELVNPTNEFHLSIIPQVDVIWREKRVESCGNDKNKIALANHLHHADSTFDASFDSESERLQRENRKALGCSNSECILFLIKADMCDLFVSKHLF